jgi:RHS repeat-associated protein
MTFTVTGTNLPDTTSFFLTDCPSPTLLTGGTATQRQFKCTPSYTGGSKSGEVKDKTSGTLLKSFTVNVASLLPTVTEVIPATAVLNQLTTFTVKGTGFTDSLTFYLDECPDPILVTGGTTTQRQFKCTPKYKAGNKAGGIKNKSGTDGVVLKEFIVNVLGPTVTGVAPLITTLGQETTFTVTGSNLSDSLAFWLKDCPTPTLLSGGTTIQRQFKCTPTYTGGSKAGEVKDKAGTDGVVLMPFTVTVNDLAIPRKLTANVINSGSASGQVYSDPVGIQNCRAGSQGTCAALFSTSTVRLTAVPVDANSTAEFGAGCAATDTVANTCDMSMTADKTIAVTFKPKAATKLRLEFDSFPQVLKVLPNGTFKIALRVTSSPDTTINRLDVDWKGDGKGQVCRQNFAAFTDIVTCEHTFTSSDLGYQILTATAYSNSGQSNMVRLRYEVTSTPGAVKYTGHQNQEYLKKFFTINPNSNKSAFAVDTATGTQGLQLDLLQQYGLIDLDFSMKYNSGLAKGSAKGTLGRGWNHNYGLLAKLEVQTGKLILNWSEGRKNTFLPATTKNLNCTGGSNDYCEESARLEGRLDSYFDKIAKQADGSYILTKKDQTKYFFDSTGSLQRIQNRKGQAFELSYDVNKRLAQILEPISGIKLSYAYNADGSISTITDVGGRVVRFYYSGNDLDYISVFGGIKHDFDYNADGEMIAYKVTGAEESTQYFENTFDSLGRVTSQKDARGSYINFSYDESTPGYIITQTIMKNGNILTDKYTANYQLVEHRDQAGSNVVTYAYNESGLLRRMYMTTQGGLQTDYEYDQNFGKITKIIYPDRLFINKYYDSNGNLIQEEDELGKYTNYTYYGNSMLESVSNQFDGTQFYKTQYSLSPVNAAAPSAETVISPSGKQTLKTYKNGRLESVTDPEKNKTVYTYDAVGNIIQKDLFGANGVLATTTKYEYNGLGQLVKTIDTEGNVTTKTWSIHGDELTMTDANGWLTRFEYDGNGNLNKKVDAQKNVTTFAYDEYDNLVTETDAEGRKHHYYYDQKNRLKAEFRHGNSRLTDTLVSYDYDDLGNLLKRNLHPDGNLGGAVAVEQYTYDKRGRKTQSIDRRGSTDRMTTFILDNKGRVTKLRDPKGNETNLSYFDTDEIRSVTDAANGVAGQHIDGDGNRDSLSDPNRNTTAFAHTSKKKLASEKPQVGGPVVYTYNALQLLETRKNSREQSESFTYYKNGWLKSDTFDGKTWSYQYDKNGNVLGVTGSDGTITRTYDELNRVTSYTDTLGNQIKYGYDKAGNLTTLTYPGNLVVTYSYNLDNRLETVADWKGRVLVRYEYTVGGRLKKESRNNGTVREYVYGYASRNLNVGELTSITEKVAATGHVIASYTFAYDAAGNITNETTVPEPTLDALKIPAVAMTYTGDNRLATFNTQAVTYDADGNMTNGPLGTGFAAFSYDTRNRLTQAGTTQYTYTVENHRIKVNQNGQTTTYVVNPHATLSQALIKKDPDGKITYYIYGNGLVAQIADNTTSYYHYDLRGSTVALTNDAGTITDRFTYLPYGEVTSHTGNIQTPFQFVGKYGIQRDNNGLLQMRARYYQESTRRFVNRDISSGKVISTGTLNRYSYSLGNPVSLIDTDGMFPELIKEAGMAGWHSFRNFSEIAVTKAIYDPGLELASTTEETYYGVRDANGFWNGVGVLCKGGGKMFYNLASNAGNLANPFLYAESSVENFINSTCDTDECRQQMIAYNELAFGVGEGFQSINDLASSLKAASFQKKIINKNSSNKKFNAGLQASWKQAYKNNRNEAFIESIGLYANSEKTFNAYNGISVEKAVGGNSSPYLTGVMCPIGDWKCTLSTKIGIGK